MAQTDKPYRYDEDLTGKNPDNLVSGETITLSNKDQRIAVFRYGPAFLDSVVLFDANTGQRLEKDVHYRVPWISHELSLRAAAEVVHSVLITDTKVSGVLTGTYQAFGGSVMPLSQEIMNAYEMLLNDNRTVDWLSGVFGKPNAYPPSAHPTFFADIYGWQALGFQIERLTQAITLGNTPAFEQILQAYQTNASSLENMESGEKREKLVSLEGLLHIRDKYHFNTMTIQSRVSEVADGGGFWVDVTASFTKKGQVYYWAVEHIDTDDLDFVTRNGLITIVNGQASFFVQTSRDNPKEANEKFAIGLHLHSPEGVEVIRTDELMIRRHGERGNVNILSAMQACCWMEVGNANHPLSYAITPHVQRMRRLPF